MTLQERELIEAYAGAPVVKKLTPERLARVEKIQHELRGVAEDLSALIEQEQNGWTPGEPTPMSARVKPLEGMLAEVEKGVASLEVLYS